MMECLKKRKRKVTWVGGGGWGGKLGKPPNTHFGLSHHQEESQTQTAFPPKAPSPRTVKTAVWPVKR